MIYHSILYQHLTNPDFRFPAIVSRLATQIVAASLAVHNKCCQVFLPTAVKFHYVFNLRDLSNVFQVRRRDSGRATAIQSVYKIVQSQFKIA